MKIKALIISIFFISCSNSNYANENQINWCLAKTNLMISYLDENKFTDAVNSELESELRINHMNWVTANDILKKELNEEKQELFPGEDISLVTFFDMFAGSYEDIENGITVYERALKGKAAPLARIESQNNASRLCKIWEELSY